MSTRLNIISSLYHKRMYVDLLKIVAKEIAKIEEENNGAEKLAPKARYYQALSYVNLNRYSEALDVLDEMLLMNISASFRYQCQMLKGYLLAGIKKYIQAEAVFRGLINDGYESAMIYGALGHVLYCDKREREAITLLQKGHDISPENLNVLNSLSYILAETGIDFGLANTYIEKVLKGEPKNPAYLDTYGFILARMKRFKEAERVLTYAYQFNPHPLIKEHLDDVKKNLSLQRV